MTDEQLRIRMINKRIIIIAVFIFLISCVLLYYWFIHADDITRYEAEKARESGLNSQVAQLEAANNNLRGTIEQTGKELVSFSEDKIKYINLASKLSEQYSVQINKLTVSNVWNEGTMAGMTTSIEVEGSLSAVRDFVNSYCDSQYTNRINVVSCRPLGIYPWFVRTIDGEQVQSWMDLSEEEVKQQLMEKEQLAELTKAAQEAGLPAALPESILAEQEEEDKPITLEKMFAEKTYKVYLVIDFLGRQ